MATNLKSDFVSNEAPGLDWGNGVALGLNRFTKRLFNVLEYGAEADGSTDDTEAIQDAIDACELAGGGEVYFPAGVYRVTNLVINESKVILRGKGRETRLLAAVGATGDMITFTFDGATLQERQHIAHNGLEDMYLDGNFRREDIGCLFLDRVNEFYMKGVIIRHFKRSALRGDSWRESRVIDCEFRTSGDGFNDYPGIDLRHTLAGSDGSNFLYFIGCTIAYSFGPQIWCGCTAEAQNEREIWFIGCIIHSGQPDGTWPMEGEPAFETDILAQGNEAAVIIQDASGINFMGCRCLGVGPGQPWLAMINQPLFVGSTVNSVTFGGQSIISIGTGISWTDTVTADAGTDTLTASTETEVTSGARIQFTTTGTLPAGLSLLTDYFVVRTGLTTFQLAPSYIDALEGTNLINITGAGTGTHTAATVHHFFLVEDAARFTLSDAVFGGGEPRAHVICSETADNALRIDLVTAGANNTQGRLLVESASTTYNEIHSQLILPDLPTSDPLEAGQLWNNAGVLNVSAG